MKVSKQITVQLDGKEIESLICCLNAAIDSDRKAELRVMDVGFAGRLLAELEDAGGLVFVSRDPE